jgi:hypothetical protein
MPKTVPDEVTDPDNRHRIRHDTISKAGSHPAPRQPTAPHRRRANLRRNCVILFIQDLDIRIVNATAELLRELVLDPSRDYQSTGAPKRHAERPRK